MSDHNESLELSVSELITTIPNISVPLSINHQDLTSKFFDTNSTHTTNTLDHSTQNSNDFNNKILIDQSVLNAVLSTQERDKNKVYDIYIQNRASGNGNYNKNVINLVNIDKDLLGKSNIKIVENLSSKSDIKKNDENEKESESEKEDKDTSDEGADKDEVHLISLDNDYLNINGNDKISKGNNITIIQNVPMLIINHTCCDQENCLFLRKKKGETTLITEKKKDEEEEKRAEEEKKSSKSHVSIFSENGRPSDVASDDNLILDTEESKNVGSSSLTSTSSEHLAHAPDGEHEENLAGLTGATTIETEVDEEHHATRLVESIKVSNYEDSDQLNTPHHSGSAIYNGSYGNYEQNEYNQEHQEQTSNDEEKNSSGESSNTRSSPHQFERDYRQQEQDELMAVSNAIFNSNSISSHRFENISQVHLAPPDMVYSTNDISPGIHADQYADYSQIIKHLASTNPIATGSVKSSNNLEESSKMNSNSSVEHVFVESSHHFDDENRQQYLPHLQLEQEHDAAQLRRSSKSIRDFDDDNRQLYLPHLQLEQEHDAAQLRRSSKSNRDFDDDNRQLYFPHQQLNQEQDAAQLRKSSKSVRDFNDLINNNLESKSKVRFETSNQHQQKDDNYIRENLENLLRNLPLLINNQNKNTNSNGYESSRSSKGSILKHENSSFKAYNNSSRNVNENHHSRTRTSVNQGQQQQQGQPKWVLTRVTKHITRTIKKEIVCV